MRKGRNRKSPRLRGFDYSSNHAFFVTICTHAREHLFGKIKNGNMTLNDFGDVVFWQWYASEQIRKEVFLDAFVIMPNHIHGIVLIQQPNEAQKPTDPEKPDEATHPITDPHPVGTQGLASLQTPQFNRSKRSLSTMVSGFKSSVTIRINWMRETPGNPVWQDRYHDHIIRNEHELQGIRQYIYNNPANWDTDEDNL